LRQCITDLVGRKRVQSGRGLRERTSDEWDLSEGY
jgi:hypothetical protein